MKTFLMVIFGIMAVAFVFLIEYEQKAREQKEVYFAECCRKIEIVLVFAMAICFGFALMVA